MSMIDLHMHTTASDGTSTPEALVASVARVGISTMSVTDHDTMAAVPLVTVLATQHGLACVSGIEITSVHDGHDVHLLGYFLRPDAPALVALLARLRGLRTERAAEIAGRLSAAGAPIDIDRLLNLPEAGLPRSIGRPQIARALVAAGHVMSVDEAFDRFLSEGRGAYVPHCGPSPREAVSVIRDAGGIASLAHPGTLRRDDLVPSLVDAGLSAVEAYHSAHDASTEQHYVQLARAHDLAISGGSDFHGDGARRSEFFGVVSLPQEEFERLVARSQM